MQECALWFVFFASCSEGDERDVPLFPLLQELD